MIENLVDMKRLHGVLFGLCLAMLAAEAAVAKPVHAFEAQVISVSDGDTLTVLDSNQLQHKIRLAGIDAPEKGQPFGDRAKQRLSRAVIGKPVRIEWAKQDRYGRYVGKVWLSSPDMPCSRMADANCPKNVDVNRAHLSVGLAWHYKEYEREQSAEDRAAYAFEENEARARRAGLWAEPDPVPPWDWRHGTAGGPIKKADRSGICHTPASPSYSALKHFTPYRALEECLASGGRTLNQQQTARAE